MTIYLVIIITFVILFFCLVFRNKIVEKYRWFRVVESVDNWTSDKVYIVQEMSIEKFGLWRPIKQFETSNEAFDFYLMLKSKKSRYSEEIIITDLKDRLNNNKSKKELDKK